MEKIEETKNNVSWYAEQQPTSNLQILNGTSHSVHSQPLVSETVTNKLTEGKIPRLQGLQATHQWCTGVIPIGNKALV